MTSSPHSDIVLFFSSLPVFLTLSRLACHNLFFNVIFSFFFLHFYSLFDLIFRASLMLRPRSFDKCLCAWRMPWQELTNWKARSVSVCSWFVTICIYPLHNIDRLIISLIEFFIDLLIDELIDELFDWFIDCFID